MEEDRVNKNFLPTPQLWHFFCRLSHAIRNPIVVLLHSDAETRDVMWQCVKRDASTEDWVVEKPWDWGLLGFGHVSWIVCCGAIWFLTKPQTNADDNPEPCHICCTAHIRTSCFSCCLRSAYPKVFIFPGCSFLQMCHVPGDRRWIATCSRAAG